MTSWRTHRRGGPPCWDRGGLTGPGGCGLGSGAKDSGPAAAGRTPGEKIELTFWSWVPGVDKAVDLWNSEHPEVKVELEKIPAGGAGGYAKMHSALQAGLVDLTKYGVDDDRSKFVEWQWQQASYGDGVYAVRMFGLSNEW